MLHLFIIAMAFFMSMGMLRWRARPLPEPHGTMPSAVSECTSERATSFTVPSPPTATAMSVFSATQRLAISAAWPAYSVNMT